MSKKISAEELAEIVTNLLTDPQKVGELESVESFRSFMTDIGKVVADHCGGIIHGPADPLDDVWYIRVDGDDSLPDPKENIWSPYDPDGELSDPAQCSRCEAETDSVIGTPQGDELCADCFAAGDEHDVQLFTPESFVAYVATLRIWDYDSDLKTPEELESVDEDGEETHQPSDGVWDSHCSLMELIEDARRIMARTA